MGNDEYLTVSQINDVIHDLFLGIPYFQNISLRGEIINFKGANRSGHYYFSLKDSKSVIQAVVFKFDSFNLDMNLKNGDDVIVKGNISSYSPSGTYQIIIKEISLFGVGNLLLEREKLKEKLTKLGYFDEEHKKEIPQYAENIAIITGKNSAAKVDFEFNILRRYPVCNITFYECLVQGEKAISDIVSSIELADKNNFDIIIIGRGGGSSDDLSAFDSEEVVKAIYDCKTPVISAVGHEINKTFSDFVADKYASTPTGACEIAVPNYIEILSNINFVYKNIIDSVKHKIISTELKVSNLKNLKAFSNASYIYDERINYVNDLKKRIEDGIKNKINLLSNQINMSKKIIFDFNPKNLLKKGYSILKDENGNIIKEVNDLKKNDKINIKLYKGVIKAQVEEVKNEK